MGINLAANEPALAGAEARAFVAPRSGTRRSGGGDRQRAQRLLQDPTSIPCSARRLRSAPRLRLSGLSREYLAEVAAVPSLTLAGRPWRPARSRQPGSWINTIPDFLRRSPNLTTMTRAPLSAAQLLRAPQLAAVPDDPPPALPVRHVGLADGLGPGSPGACASAARSALTSSTRWRAGARRASGHLRQRLVGDRRAVHLAHAGVDGVNLHTLPDAAYELFAFSRRGGRWEAPVRPVYYGLQLFAHAAPPGARLLAVSRRGADSGLSVWATRAPDRRIRIVSSTRARLRARR